MSKNVRSLRGGGFFDNVYATSYTAVVNSNLCSRTYRLAAIHNVTDKTTTDDGDGLITVVYKRDL